MGINLHQNPPIGQTGGAGQSTGTFSKTFKVSKTIIINEVGFAYYEYSGIPTLRYRLYVADTNELIAQDTNYTAGHGNTTTQWKIWTLPSNRTLAANVNYRLEVDVSGAWALNSTIGTGTYPTTINGTAVDLTVTGSTGGHAMGLGVTGFDPNYIKPYPFEYINYTTLGSWTSTMNGTFTLSGTGQANDLLILIFMKSSGTLTITSPGWTHIAPNYDAAANGVYMAFKKLTPTDLALNVTMNGVGGATLVHLRNVRVVEYGSIPFGSSRTFNYTGPNSLIMTSAGDGNQSVMPNQGFGAIANGLANTHYTAGYTAYYKNFMDTITATASPQWGDPNQFWMVLGMASSPTSVPRNYNGSTLPNKLPATTLIPNLQWNYTNTVVQATQSAYQVQVVNANNLTQVVWDSGKVTSGNNNVTVPTGVLSPNTEYAWKVKVWDSYGVESAYSTVVYFYTTQAPVVVPTNPLGTISIPQGTIIGPVVEWTYTDNENHTQAKAQIEVYNSSDVLVHDSGMVVNTGLSYDIPDEVLIAGQVYHWRIRVQDTTGMNSAWTGYNYFITNHPPDAPIIQSPVDTLRTNKTPKIEALIGNDVEDNGQHFEVQISDYSNFTANVVSYSTKNQSSYFKAKVSGGSFQNVNNVSGVGSEYEGGVIQFSVPTSANLLDNKTYYYRVRAVDVTSTAAGAWSEVRSIRVGNYFEISLANPIITSDKAERIFILGKYTLSNDGVTPASMTVEVTNNGLDENPVWEDITEEFLQSQFHIFENTSKTAESFAVNVRIKIQANDTLGIIEFKAFAISFD